MGNNQIRFPWVKFLIPLVIEIILFIFGVISLQGTIISISEILAILTIAGFGFFHGRKIGSKSLQVLSILLLIAPVCAYLWFIYALPHCPYPYSVC